MQYKSQEAAMQARSLDGQGKSHSHSPESGTYGAGAARSTTSVNTAAAGNLAGATREVHGFLAEIEHLITSMTPLTGEDLARAKAALGERVAAAKRSFEEMSDALVVRARKSAAAADEYVHEQPWKFIGAGAATGLVLGFLLGRRR